MQLSLPEKSTTYSSRVVLFLVQSWDACFFFREELVTSYSLQLTFSNSWKVQEGQWPKLHFPF